MSEVILAVLEHQRGKLSRMSWEAVAAAQKIGAELSAPAEAVVLGNSVGKLAEEAAAARLERVHVLEHSLLNDYTPDAYCAALAELITALKPRLVLLPHSYQVRDLAPKLAAMLGRPLLSDCTGLRVENGTLILTRQVFQGKMNADLSFAGEPPFFASLQAGCFSADQVMKGAEPAPIELRPAQIAPSQVRSKPQEPFQEGARTVDLSQAERIVAAGRGIKEPQNLELAKKLAEALGAELGGSRPICDNGWLPMERQIGSSGQTVAPKLYVALGISGAIQHIVGMKSSRTVVAINQDKSAPIFEIADYGIVGNLFEIVPALIAEIQKAKGQSPTG